MFGNIMEFTLPRFTVHSNNFNFDLQRFDLSDTQGDGSVFSCVKDGKTQYGTAEDFTTNNVGTATEIKLLKDFSISANVDVSSTCTFDLNGKTLTSTADNDTNGGDTAYALIVKSGNLTVKGTTAGSIVSSKARAIKVEKNATLEIENNVTVSGFTRGVVNFGTVNLKGGTITATENGVAFNQDTKGGTFNGGDITAQRGVVNFSTQKVTINDANITATGLGVQLSAGSLEMNGGTITSKGTAAYVAGGATFTMNDGNIIADSSNVDTSNVEPDSKGEYSVWGAQGVEIASGSSESDRATFNMNGGSIVTKLPDNYHGDGKSAKTVEIADQGVVIWAYGVFKMSGGEIHTNNYFALTGNGSEEYRSYKEATDSKLQRYKLEGGIYSKDDNGAYVKNANYGGHTTIEISGVKVDASAAKSSDIYKLRRKTSMVFQNYNLFRNMTALENVMEPMITVQKVDRKAAELRARDLLAKVGLSDKENFYPRKMSGGQQQRVGIARAVASDAEVILFDEPTSSLDPELTGEVLEVIRRLAKTNITMLIVHEMKFAREIADTMIFLEGGVVAGQGSPSEIFEHSENERIRRFVSMAMEG